MYDLKTLVLIHRNDILEQHIQNFNKDLGKKTGKISQGVWKTRKVTVATVQSLMANLKRDPDKVKAYLASVEYLIFDEAHHAEAATWKKISTLIKNAKVRHGFSGTPYSLGVSDLELECVTGVVGHRVTLSQLIDWGYAARPVITMRHIYSDMVDGYNYHKVYSAGVVNNKELNTRAVKDIISCIDKGLLTLVIVRSVKHGKIIHTMLRKELGKNGPFDYINGSTPQEMRNEVKELFAKGEIKALIVSAIWNEGVDVPSANALVKLDGGGGSDVRDEKGIRTTVQQVGRVIRKDRKVGTLDVDTEVEQLAYVFDYYIHSHKWLERHSKNRMKTYKLEKAFKIKEVGKL